MSYLVCHMEKYKRQDVAPVEKENERGETYEASNPQIDSGRTMDNYHLISPRGSYIEMINERLSTLDLKRKIRSDAILMNSFVVSSDRAFFERLPPWRHKEFFGDCVKFFAEKYGRENILSAVVHLDETTPHLHLNFVPINDGRLSSKSLFDKQKLAELQTEFYEQVGRKYALQRGKEGSTAKHLDTAEFKAKKIVENAQAQADKTTEEAKRDAHDYLLTIQKAVESEQNKPVPKKKKEAAEEIVSLRTENAALRERLKISDNDRMELFRHMRQAEAESAKKDEAYQMVTTIEAVFPGDVKGLYAQAKAEQIARAERNHNLSRGKGFGNSK